MNETTSILVVDDEEGIRNYLRTLLKLKGYEVATVSSGNEAIEYFSSNPLPSLVLMDILMPGMDGMEATRILRANPETRDIPILAVTVLITECELNRCVEADCNDYIVKPFTTQELLRKMAEFIPSSSEAPLSWGVA